ncbi:unnamed protein product [Arctia plantaginis]|uniref:Cytidine deaminase n=1 Tax=Arctia plantaginis TaxID=874455 RepID=A0A8S0ZC60_ARCPL|nr:unnamed protein product [Arctia plantaginis]CAB3234260.1 unnamed protein product [Arctia plantaginis]
MENFTVVQFDSLSATVQQILKMAAEERKKAYCPYSNFAVGSAILTEKGDKIYTGCNIESATMTPSLCAERTAVAKAVSDGYSKIQTVAVVAHQQNFTAPCGVCRQMLSEFRSSNGDIEIFLSRPSLDEVLHTSISELLPLAYVSFKEDSLP